MFITFHSLNYNCKFIFYCLSWCQFSTDVSLIHFDLHSGGEVPILRSLSFACFYASGMHFREPQQLMPLGHNTRVFISFLWIYVIILTTAYSSNLTAFLTVTRRPQGIDTIRSLHAAHMEVSGLGSFFKGALASAVDPYLQVNYILVATFLLYLEILNFLPICVLCNVTTN